MLLKGHPPSACIGISPGNFKYCWGIKVILHDKSEGNAIARVGGQERSGQSRAAVLDLEGRTRLNLPSAAIPEAVGD